MDIDFAGSSRDALRVLFGNALVADTKIQFMPISDRIVDDGRFGTVVPCRGSNSVPNLDCSRFCARGREYPDFEDRARYFGRVAANLKHTVIVNCMDTNIILSNGDEML